MERDEFIRRLFRYVLIGILGTIALVTGSRIASGAGCNECPGKGICSGESDCSMFLKK